MTLTSLKFWLNSTTAVGAIVASGVVDERAARYSRRGAHYYIDEGGDVPRKVFIDMETDDGMQGAPA